MLAKVIVAAMVIASVVAGKGFELDSTLVAEK